jgi:hypothetical protein
MFLLIAFALRVILRFFQIIKKIAGLAQIDVKLAREMNLIVFLAIKIHLEIKHQLQNANVLTDILKLKVKCGKIVCNAI